jgi:DNA-binding protein HU-beta
MTKAELINVIVEDTGIDRPTVAAAIESFMGQVKKTTINGDTIFLRGFGSFGSKKRAAKLARNISTNTTLMVPACSIPVFKPSKDFVISVKENTKE